MKAKRILPRSKWQTICLYSESGAGKTTLSATAPSPIFLNSNKGTLSVASEEHKRYEVDVNGMDDLDAAYANFTDTGDENWKGRFKTAVFDHFDDIQGIIMDELVEKAMEKDDRRDDTVEQREYGILYNKLARYLRKFRKLPCHRILICGLKEDFETGKARPSLIGQMAQKLPYFVDHTMYLRVNEKTEKRYLHFHPTEDFYAKTRAFWIPKEDRKIRIDLDDTQALTKLFDLIAAGPTSSTSKQRENAR